VEKSSSVSEGGNVQFSKRVYSVSLAEAERPPVVALTMQVTNKPRDIRFMMCAIRDGNLRGAFSVSPNAAGDCELRTQVQLDRETMEQYRLNISVESGGQVDFAVVQLSVMDANDNAPRFVFPPQTERSASEVRNEYLAVVSMDAPAFEHFFTITVMAIYTESISQQINFIGRRCRQRKQ
jgi:hypothetical protein